jgi:hypothetical protein
MPTPESELFLAKKPKVAPTFEGVDYDDNTALKAAQDAIIREQWVKSMMARLVRDEMGKCYRREGVNHLEKCGHLRGMDTEHYAPKHSASIHEAYRCRRRRRIGGLGPVSL